MDAKQIYDMMTPRGDTAPSDDEVRRFLDGGMPPEEMVDFQHFLSRSPEARLAVDLALRAKPDPSRSPRGLRLVPVGLAVGAAALAAFFVGRDHPPLAVSHVPPFGVARQGATTARERELEAKLESTQRALDASLARANAPAAEPNRLQGDVARLKAELDRLRAEKPQESLAARPARPRRPSVVKEGAAPRQVAMGHPGKTTRWTEPDAARTLGGEEPPLASPPTLESPPPEARSSAAALDRLVLAPPAVRTDYDWAIWTTDENGTPTRRLPDPTAHDEGDRTTLVLASRLGPGRYAVGVRPKVPPHPLDSERERRWQTYGFRVLSPEEVREDARAPDGAWRDPIEAALTLYRLDRLGEARLVLRVAPKGPDTAKALADVERRIAALRKGGVLSTDLEPSSDAPPTPAVPVEVAIQTPTPPGDSTEALQALFHQAVALETPNDAASRLDLFLQGAAMAERLKDPIPTSKAGLAILRGLAMAETRSAEAEPYVEPTVEAARRALGQAGENPIDARETYLMVGYFGSAAYNRTQHHDQALDLAREAKPLAPQGMDSRSLEHLTYEEALALQGLQRLEEAKQGWLDCLAIFDTPPKRTHDPSVWIEIPSDYRWRMEHSATEYNLAQCLYQLGEYDPAITACEEALKTQGGAGRIGPLMVKASAEIELGEDDRVKADFEAASPLVKSAPKDLQAQYEIVRGVGFLERLETTDARRHLLTAKGLAHDAQRPDMEQTADLNLELVDILQNSNAALAKIGDDVPPATRQIRLDHLANVLLIRGRWDDAAKAARDSLKLAEGKGLRGFRARALDSLAWAEANQGGEQNLKDACQHFDMAREAFEATLAGSLPERIGTIQKRSLGDVYPRYAWALVKSGDPKRAQAVLNAGRALGLRARRGDRRRQEEDAIKKAIEGRPNTLFLQYATLGAHRTLLLASYREEGKPVSNATFDLTFGTTEIGNAMAAWKPGVRPAPDDPKHPERKIKAEEQEQSSAAALGNLLLGPLESKGLLSPDRFPHLVVVGDGLVQSVPFAALVVGGGRLVERFAVGYEPALGLDAPGVSVAPRALGIAAYLDAKTLPGIAREVREVTARFPGSPVWPGAEAVAPATLRAMADCRVLLLAGHGGIGLDDPMNASLRFAPSEGANLTGRTVLSLGLRADLAVLAACSTAVGRDAMGEGGEGPMGLAWAFQAAGCRSVVATAWDVDDDASCDLVLAFLDALKAGSVKDVALQAAQRDFLADKGHAKSRHPFYWAGVKLIGDPRPVRF